MYQRRRARILIGVLLVVSLVLITMDVRGEQGSLLDRLRGTATTVFTPIQDGVSTIVRPIGDAFSGSGEWFRLRSENAQLRERVERLEERRRATTDLERENRELTDLLGISERFQFDTVTARTVALAPSSFEWTISIDVGSDDGVARDMPVINGAGLVGRVVQVTPSASRVLLAIDPSFFASARSGRTGEVGSLGGRGGEPLALQPVDPTASIEVGDEIVTSSYAGGVFPAGIPIGVVSDAGDPSARLNRSIEVLPYVDFTQLHHVMVVLNAPVDPVPPLDGTADIPFIPPSIRPQIDPDDLEEIDPLDEEQAPDGEGDDAEEDAEEGAEAGDEP